MVAAYGSLTESWGVQPRLATLLAEAHSGLAPAGGEAPDDVRDGRPPDEGREAEATTGGG
jgi:hypothetical protein